MVSKLNIIGLVILLLGVIPLILFNIIGLRLPPFVVAGGSLQNSHPISAGNTRPIEINGQVDGHPIPVFLKVSFLIDHNQEFDCFISLFLDSDNPEIGQDLFVTSKSFSGTGSGSTWKSFQIVLVPPYSSSSYTFSLEVQNPSSSNDITVSDARIQVTFTLWATAFPALLAVIGVIISIVGFIRARRGPAVPKKPKVTPGWEPTLQWGSSAAGDTKTTGRRPKMAIKSTKAAKPTKKPVVRRAAPTSGTQASCKFCGKNVSATAFFCPHCYGKLR
ncbi:MAG: hypothetical protein ACFE95_16290 [Candidatus Hodarchaeota archaeon]